MKCHTRRNAQGRNLGVIAMAFAALASLSLTGCVSACPTIGFSNTSPIEIVIDGAVEPVELSACLNAECTPVPVIAETDGRWLVPQDEPYLDGADPSTVTVEVTSGGVTTRGTYEIPREPERDWLNQCRVPFVYLPVVVDAA